MATLTAANSYRVGTHTSHDLGHPWRTMDPDFAYTKSGAKVRVAAVAEPTWGRIHWTQLRRLGIAEGTIGQWVREGYLFPELPRVYSIGHRSGPIEADLAEALLYT